MDAQGRALYRSVDVALAWSGGKDSALALRALGNDPSVRVRALLTTVTEGYERISMHGVRRALLERQTAAAGVPLVEIRIPPGCPNEIYEERLARALASPALAGVDDVAFGDLFLEDVRAYREERLAAAGKRATRGLMGRARSEAEAEAHLRLCRPTVPIVPRRAPRRAVE